MIKAFQNEILSIQWAGIVSATFNLHAIIVLFGGIFILYTAMKENFAHDDVRRNER